MSWDALHVVHKHNAVNDHISLVCCMAFALALYEHLLQQRQVVQLLHFTLHCNVLCAPRQLFGCKLARNPAKLFSSSVCQHSGILVSMLRVVLATAEVFTMTVQF